MLALLALLAATLLYLGRPYWAWVAPGAIGLAWWATEFAGGQSVGTSYAVVAGTVVVLAIIFGLPAVRALIVSRLAMRVMRQVLPRIGETERIALEAGTVWLDGDLFSGAPNWRKLLDFEIRTLSEKERAFLDGPVEELCAMLDEWTVTRNRDLPPEVWDHLKRHGYFGMIIPEQHGGLGFSAAGHSAVIVKIASRSITAAVTVMVPNSLGPAELLLHYGTEMQRAHYLPRLARGEEIPCFALTGPEAGSDAAATQSVGIVCRGEYQGAEVLGIRLSWRKRYITLGPIATVIGLAFRLRDPDHLIGDRQERGITCALVPANLPGINIGARHDPMGVPFQNGPNWGTDVFVPDRLHHRRSGHGRAGLADAHGQSRGRPVDFAARAGHVVGPARDASHRRLRNRARTIRHTDRAFRGHRGATGPNLRPDLHDGGSAPSDGGRRRRRRKAGRLVGYRQGLSHREHATDHQ